MIKKIYIGLHVQLLSLLSNFNEKKFNFFRNTEISNFMKIRTMGAE
jgi:hypothetical protein